MRHEKAYASAQSDHRLTFKHEESCDTQVPTAHIKYSDHVQADLNLSSAHTKGYGFLFNFTMMGPASDT